MVHSFRGFLSIKAQKAWRQEWLSLRWKEHVAEQLSVHSLAKKEAKEWDQKSGQAIMLKGLPVVIHFLQPDPAS